MTVETFSKTAVATAVQADLEAKLAAVKVRISEIEGQLPDLRDTESWLEGILAAAGAAPAAVVAQAAAAAPVAAAAAGVKVPRPRRARSQTAASEPAAKPAAAGTKAKAKPAAKKSSKKAAPKKEAAATPAAAPAVQPSSTQRALAFLQEAAGPQKAVEIAQHLFGTQPTQGNVNLVRSAVETLVRRGAVTKSKQGTTAFYEAERGAANSAVPAGSETTPAAAETAEAAAE